ncbi:MAG: amidohydrolase [Candidatus Tectomicrobia bacterium]|nr:amidohydrolase [Candidatus Tectomicrobia bacterium]
MTTDLLLSNGNVYTMDAVHPKAEAVAISGEKILAVGSSKELQGLVGPETRQIDLAGRVLLPGLIDAHLHFANFSIGLTRINLDGLHSLEEALKLISDHVNTLPPGAWLIGRGWNHNEWDPPKFPDKTVLDRIAPHNPIFLRRKDGHVIWVNSLALQFAHVTADSVDPPGGRIDRDERGEPVGILREKSQDLISQIIPQATQVDLQEAIKRGIHEAHRLGITSVHDCEGPMQFLAFENLLLRQELPLRVSMLIPSANLDEAIKVGLRSGFGNSRLRIGQVKIFADGTLGSSTALMLEPFEGQPGNYGIAVASKEEIAEIVRRALSAGFGTAIHAIGDRANRDMLDIYEEHQAVNQHYRCRIEHVQILHPDDIPRFARLGVIASMQPLHATSDMPVADKFWGKRARYSYAWRSLLKSGAALAFGSDCPVETLDPFTGIHAAVTRQRANGEPEGGWYPEERLSVAEAVYGYTMGAAYASGEEAIKGSITPGKLADLIVLSHDIFTIHPAKILETVVDSTIFDGEVVYERG